MLSLDAEEWKDFIGGYKVPYDASITLQNLEESNQPNEQILNELWENLYHQGDVDVASYASIPHILRIFREKGWANYHLPGLVMAVEHARLQGNNPELPEWLKMDYSATLHGTIQYCLRHAAEASDKNFSRAVLMLAAVILGDEGAYVMLDEVSIGDEKLVVELYYQQN
jgi:hypothetical protein